MTLSCLLPFFTIVADSTADGSKAALKNMTRCRRFLWDPDRCILPNFRLQPSDAIVATLKLSPDRDIQRNVDGGAKQKPDT